MKKFSFALCLFHCSLFASSDVDQEQANLNYWGANREVSLSVFQKEAAAKIPVVVDCTPTAPNEQKSSADRSFFERDALKKHRIDIRHREANGIGYSQGYTSLDGFFSMSSGNVYPFLDLRGHVFNNGKLAANAGIGVRYLAEDLNVVFGANAYYDYRQKKHAHYNQIGAGFEALWRKWDLRLNGYFPVGRVKHRIHEGFWGFKEHAAYFSKEYEFAMMGGDLELGRELYQHKYFDLHAMLAGYYFNGDYGKESIGGLFRATSRIANYLTLEGQISYDSLFHFIAQGEVTLTFPFGGYPKTKPKSRSLANRLVESVPRFEIIITKKHDKKAIARDPSTGDPLYFVFVDNVNGGSNGSYEHPYATLLDAQNHSSPGDAIYVFAGDGTTTGMDQGITLQNSQKLLGSGTPYTVASSFGSQSIPAQTAQMPSITNVGAGSAIRIASGNTINGLIVDNLNSSFPAISNFLSSVGTTIITNNVINNVASAVSLRCSDDANITIANNHFSQVPVINTLVIIRQVGGNATVNIFSNTFTGFALGLGVLSEAVPPMAFTLTANIFNNRIEDGFDAFSFGINGRANNENILFLNVSNNTLSNIALSGISVNADDDARVYAQLTNNFIRVSTTSSSHGGILAESNTSSGNGLAIKLLNNDSAAGVGSFGFNLIESGAGGLFVQSITGAAGVQAANIGTFTESGSVFYVPIPFEN